eukprot:CAMPEP_0119400386 /NCGR_PEP_ID=MMETSP1334-20130426/141842_1 /TAXON_ID=127549 /ORGANISM="Calcidiscus leptoporus, Strain RCC1130" /LENGTH=141 /DNA_ID=CAMNT_0007424293 /DNA_START=158 /DNA_END=584 /DNA_ORIENTATION=+
MSQALAIATHRSRVDSMLWRGGGELLLDRSDDSKCLGSVWEVYGTDDSKCLRVSGKRLGMTCLGRGELLLRPKETDRWWGNRPNPVTGSKRKSTVGRGRAGGDRVRRRRPVLLDHQVARRSSEFKRARPQMASAPRPPDNL